MLSAALFKGANLSGVQLREFLTKLYAKEYDIGEDDARREAERVVEDMAACRNTNDAIIIYEAYASHGSLLLRKRLEARGIERKVRLS